MRVFFSFFVFIFMFSCNAVPIPTNFENGFHVLYESEYGGAGVNQTTIFTGPDLFGEWWSENMSGITGKNVPEIDFSKKWVVVKHLESQRSGGATYKVAGTKQLDGELHILYLVNSPEGMGTDAITSPLMVVEIDQPLKESVIKFELIK